MTMDMTLWRDWLWRWKRDRVWRKWLEIWRQEVAA